MYQVKNGKVVVVEESKARRQLGADLIKEITTPERVDIHAVALKLSAMVDVCLVVMDDAQKEQARLLLLAQENSKNN